MNQTTPSWDPRSAKEKVLGYLNFSSGGTDPLFLSALSYLFAQADRQGGGERLRVLEEDLRGGLAELRATHRAFSDVSQAEAVLDLLFHHGLNSYRSFHADLLETVPDDELFQPFFLGRFWECLLAQGGPWEETERVIQGALKRLNDYVGIRPVAVLETHRGEPYAHEWFRPVPLYIRGAGVAHGRYQRIVECALDILEHVPTRLAQMARFHWDCLEELALDIRVFDFDHPVSRAPNTIFGLWDPHTLNGQGRYCRMVVQSMMLRLLWERVEAMASARSREELEWEAGAVLAGTILMASTTCGDRPHAFASTVTLAALVQQAAELREEFYRWVLGRMAPAHQRYLKREAGSTHQPFGGVRQQLNRDLAHRRAQQMVRLQLTWIFLNLGETQLAWQHARQAGTVSGMMLCRLEGKLRDARRALEQGRLEWAAAQIPELAAMIQRGIECGALVDPWNILGLAAHFPIFGAQDAIFDHRVTALVRIVKSLFQLATAVWTAAAAANQVELCRSVRDHFQRVVDWWRQFAAHECQGVDAPHPDHVLRGAERVAEAMGHWYQAGAAAGDVAFWAPYVELFPSADAYAHVIHSLLDRHDLVASMALLTHWLSRHQEVSLGTDGNSVPDLAIRYMLQLAEAPLGNPADVGRIRWQRAKRFLELIEANADELWQVPTWENARRSRASPKSHAEQPDWFEDQEPGDDQEDIVQAAYEDVTYVDQTDDGVDSSLADVPTARPTHTDTDVDRIERHLQMLSCAARLWTVLVIHPGFAFPQADDVKRDFLLRCLECAEQFRTQLFELAEDIVAQPLPTPLAGVESVMEYDERRTQRVRLVDQVVHVAAHLGEAVMWLRSALGPDAPPAPQRAPQYSDQEIDRVAAVLHHLQCDQRHKARECFDRALAVLLSRPLVYVPVTRGGKPSQVIAARLRLRILGCLLICLPRQGLLDKACQLLDMARHMDRFRVPGPGAVTEYDELYRLGARHILDSVLAAFSTPPPEKRTGSTDNPRYTHQLTQVIRKLSDCLQYIWLDQSRKLRLSVVENLDEDRTWGKIKTFIQKYGRDLFTQPRLFFGNLRGILFQGVENWLEGLSQHEDSPPLLVQELGRRIDLKEAAQNLEFIFETLCENYSAYRDYNSTTTYSDRGDRLYILLDFLRLRVQFQRFWWNLYPLSLVHGQLVRHGLHEIAQIWADELGEHTKLFMQRVINRLRRLQRKYSVEMATIADSILLKQQFPLCESHIVALLAALSKNSEETERRRTIEELSQLIEQLLLAPCGSGMEMPDWLEAMDAEVERLRRPPYMVDDDELCSQLFDGSVVSRTAVVRQVNNWHQKMFSN